MPATVGSAQDDEEAARAMPWWPVAAKQERNLCSGLGQTHEVAAPGVGLARACPLPRGDPLSVLASGHTLVLCGAEASC